MTALPISAAAADNGDLALARRVAAGEVHAFELVMRRHNRMLFRAARSILRDDADAEDCLQAAWLRAYRAMPTFAGRSRLSTWLGRIVINEALARKRQVARRGVVVSIDSAFDADAGLPPPHPAAVPGPEREAMRHEMAEMIEHRIDAMPPVFREVFVLRALEEMSVEETAALLDIPEATVRTRFFRARSLLREALAQDIDAALDEAFAFAGARCDRIVASVLDQIDARPPPVG